ncbi:MAG: glycogen synthase, partial [Desulfatiglandales bacterium]
GVDYDIWNPATDPFIRANFDTKDLTGKILCKEDLIAEFGLPHSRVERPLVGMVTRLDPQKGMDLVLASIPDMVGLDLSLVILGNGDQRYVEGLSYLKERYPLNIGFKVAHDERLAHKVIAGSDMILVPSLFEPCGLIQMYGLRYGTIPIGRATGGLKDTISPFSYTNPHGNGILFEPFDTNGLMWAIREALRYYEDKEMWRRLILNGLGSDFSWERSAREYLELYLRLARV